MLIIVCFSIKAQIEPSFEKDIKHLIQLSGSLGSAEQMMDHLIENYKEMLPDIPADFWKEIRLELNAAALIEKIVPIYAKHYTHADIKALIAFYESPIGQKLRDKTPIVTQESISAGEAWGREIAQIVQARLEEQK